MALNGVHTIYVCFFSIGTVTKIDHNIRIEEYINFIDRYSYNLAKAVLFSSADKHISVVISGGS